MKQFFVQVDSERTENGEVVPLAVAWEDGRVWKIDRVLHSCASPDGEYEGIRYTVLIGSAVHLATPNGRFCGAKRPRCVSERPE